VKSVSWEEFRFYVRQLSDKIIASGKKYENILSLPEGIIPAFCLSKILGVPFTMDSSKATQNTLVIDTYADEDLESYAGWDLDTAALFYKKGGPEPRYYALEVKKKPGMPWDF